MGRTGRRWDAFGLAVGLGHDAPSVRTAVIGLCAQVRTDDRRRRGELHLLGQSGRPGPVPGGRSARTSCSFLPAPSPASAFVLGKLVIVESVGDDGGVPGQTKEFRAEGEGYEEAKAALQAQVPEGWRLVSVKTERSQLSAATTYVRGRENQATNLRACGNLLEGDIARRGLEHKSHRSEL